MKKNLFITILVSLAGTVCIDAKTVRGRIIDSMDKSPIVGSIVRESGTDNATTADIDGYFNLDIKDTSSSINIECIGFNPLNLKFGNEKDLGTIELTQDSKQLPNVIIAGQVVKARKTPIVASNVFYSEIEEKIGNQEFTESLKFTPGVHVNRQGGGWGDSEVFMRGFDNTNIAVMLNGIPVNDMETGTMYWSDWAAMSDMTSLIQTQRGIGAGKISIPSIGGTINIITKTSDTHKGGYVNYSTGNDGYQKMAFGVNTGYLKNGWAMSFIGSKTSGDGYIQGTNFNVLSFFASIEKRFNSNHQLNLLAFGTSHKQYSRANALTKEGWKFVKEQYCTPGRNWKKYNPDYGFNANGQRKSNEYSEYSKPFISLNYVWQINDKSSWSTNAYVTIGNGGGYAGKADEDEYSEYDWYSADYGTLNTKFRSEDGTYDYGQIEEINMASANGSKLVMTQQVGRQLNFGIVSTYTAKLSDHLDFYGGADFRRYISAHTNKIIDLFGGEYYIDPCRQDADIKNNAGATDDWKSEHLKVGDVVYRDYDTHIVQEGAHAQLEYSSEILSAFVSGSVSNTTYWKYDRYYYDSRNAKSDDISFIGGTLKGGVNWNINEYSNLFANVGFLSKAPQFKSGAFMSPTSSNITNKRAENELSFTTEIGYGVRNSILSFNACAYFTEWMDKSMTKKGKLGQQYYINMTGVDSRHMGLEFELKSTPAQWVEMDAMLSVGDWQWDNDHVKGYAYNTSGQAIDMDGNITTPGSESHASAVINMKGVKVGGSAQTTAGINITFKPFPGFRIGGDYSYFARNYAYYALSGSSLKPGKELFVNDPWKIPSYGCLDLRTSYRFNIGSCNAVISGQMFNALDKQYIEKAWNISSVSKSKETIGEAGVYMFYAPGRTWCLSLKVNF